MAAAGFSAACAVGGGVLVAFGVVFAPALLRCGRVATDRAADLAPYIEELLMLGLFEGASRAAVESVAAAIVPEQVDTGTVVVEEGHPADDLFVVRAGSFSVATRAHGTLRLMSPGDWFGEIGVLEHRPRTATVVAETRGELWRIPGAAFLSALNELTVLPDPVRRGVAARLTLSSLARATRGDAEQGDIAVTG
jgi:CRP-like cAMP-binding protein